MAPEIFEMQEYDAKADIWSVGCVFYEMLGEHTLDTSQILFLCCVILSTFCVSRNAAWPGSHLLYSKQSTAYP